MCTCKIKIINRLKEINENIYSNIVDNPNNNSEFIIEIIYYYKICVRINTNFHAFKITLHDWETNNQITLEKIGYNNDTIYRTYENIAKHVNNLYQLLMPKTILMD